MASEKTKSNTQPQYLEPIPTRSQARPVAQGIVDDVFNDALGKGVPEVVKGHDFKPDEQPSSKPAPRNLSPPKGSSKPENLKKTSSHLFKTPPDDDYYTPPIHNSSNGSKEKVHVLYPPKEKEDPKAWHDSEVDKAIKDTRKTSLKKERIRPGRKNNQEKSPENIPLLPSENDEMGCILPRNWNSPDTTQSKNHVRMDDNIWRRKSSGWKILSFFRGKSYLMSSKFSNKDYRQNFAAKMLRYKTLHMLTGYLAAILYQMTWTWEREIQKLGPPDLVRLVDDHIWVAYIVLMAYVGLAIAVRVFCVGRNRPFNVIVLISFIVMFGFKCYAACIAFGQFGAAMITTVTYALCLSYGLLYILLTLNKWPEKLDLTKHHIFHMVLPIIIITSLLSCVLNYIELKITDSAFQKQIGTMGSIFEDYLPSTLIAYIILMWEVLRIKKIVEGSVVSLLDDNEYLFGAFFI